MRHIRVAAVSLPPSRIWQCPDSGRPLEAVDWRRPAARRPVVATVSTHLVVKKRGLPGALSVASAGMPAPMDALSQYGGGGAQPGHKAHYLHVSLVCNALLARMHIPEANRLTWSRLKRPRHVPLNIVCKPRHDRQACQHRKASNTVKHTGRRGKKQKCGTAMTRMPGTDRSQKGG